MSGLCQCSRQTRVRPPYFWNYSYDLEGNTTKKVRISDGLTWTYGYDQRNMMVFAEQRATDGGTLLQRVEFEYDVFGNRIEKSVTTGSTTVQRFGWDGRSIWADLDSSSSLTTRRIYGDGVNEPIEDREGPDPINPLNTPDSQLQGPVNQGIFKSHYVLFMLGASTWF